MNSESLQNWEGQVRKGILEFVVLSILHEGENYGYEILQTVKKYAGFDVTESAIYPILNRASKEKLLTQKKRPSLTGPPRICYRLSPLGRTRLLRMRKFLEHVNFSLGQIITEQT